MRMGWMTVAPQASTIREKLLMAGYTPHVLFHKYRISIEHKKKKH